MAGQPSLFRSDIIHESYFVKQPASLGRSTVRDLNLPASAGQPSIFWVENIFLNALTSEEWRLTCHVLQVTEQWLKKTAHNSQNWRLTCQVLQVIQLTVDLPYIAGLSTENSVDTCQPWQVNGYFSHLPYMAGIPKCLEIACVTQSVIPQKVGE